MNVNQEFRSKGNRNPRLLLSSQEPVVTERMFHIIRII